VEPNGWVTGIAFNPNNLQEAWVTLGGINVGHVWHTLNAVSGSGTTWTNIDGSGAGALPANLVITALLMDPASSNVLYLGSDLGALACSTCGGSSPSPSWSALGTGLPNVKIWNLTLTHDNSTLIAWTHGRGAWSTPVLTSVFPGKYMPVVPARVLDTRYGVGGYSSPVGPHTAIRVQIAGVTGQGQSSPAVPAMTSATPPSAAVINVTATGATAASYLTVYPTGVRQPLASNLNFVAGQTVPNLVEVALGTDGAVELYNSAGSVNVIFDVMGWVTTKGTVAGTSGLFNPLSPARIMDTRDGTGGLHSPIGARATFTLQVTGASKDGGGSSGVPPSGVSAVVLNVTVTGGTAPSYLTVWPAGSSQPIASNVNFVAGQTVPNRVIVGVGAGGKINIYNSAGSVNVVVDVGGWFTDSSVNSGSQFTGLTPARILDTRNGTGAPVARVCAGQTLVVNVASQGGVPAMTSGTPPSAAVLNVTVTDTTAASYLTVYPHLATQPLASDLNWTAGQTVPNLVVVKLGTDGKIAIYNSAGCTDVIADVNGWYG
jgi:hypothetical protein